MINICRALDCGGAQWPQGWRLSAVGACNGKGPALCHIASAGRESSSLDDTQDTELQSHVDRIKGKMMEKVHLRETSFFQQVSATLCSPDSFLQSPSNHVVYRGVEAIN